MGYVEWIRGCVGHRKIFLAFASIVLRDDLGRILLQHRTDFDLWGLPGGSLERGEDLRACARRELREETGLTAGDLSLVGIYTDPRLDVTYPNGDQVQQFTVCFAGQANGGSMEVDGTENSEQRYFYADDLPYDQIHQHYQSMLKDALHGGPPAFSPPFRKKRTRSQLETVRPWIGENVYIGVGACAVVRDGDGRLLVYRQDQGNWAFPYDLLRLGENAAWTARRVVQQVSGYQVEPQRLLGIFSPGEVVCSPTGESLQAVLAVFDCSIAGVGSIPTTNPIVTWMTPEALTKLNAPPLLARLQRLVTQQVDDDAGYIAA
jgi:ADP-ribose pyrophosphatase YjhB (NUDIX family)